MCAGMYVKCVLRCMRECLLTLGWNLWCWKVSWFVWCNMYRNMCLNICCNVFCNVCWNVCWHRCCNVSWYVCWSICKNACWENACRVMCGNVCWNVCWNVCFEICWIVWPATTKLETNRACWKTDKSKNKRWRCFEAFGDLGVSRYSLAYVFTQTGESKRFWELQRVVLWRIYA